MWKRAKLLCGPIAAISFAILGGCATESNEGPTTQPLRMNERGYQTRDQERIDRIDMYTGDYTEESPGRQR